MPITTLKPSEDALWVADLRLLVPVENWLVPAGRRGGPEPEQLTGAIRPDGRAVEHNAAG